MYNILYLPEFKDSEKKREYRFFGSLFSPDFHEFSPPGYLNSCIFTPKEKRSMSFSVSDLLVILLMMYSSQELIS